MRFELATHGLGSRYSTTELRPHHIVLLETSVQASLFYPRIAKKSRLQKKSGPNFEKGNRRVVVEERNNKQGRGFA